jgi:hypothetical protein
MKGWNLRAEIKSFQISSYIYRWISVTLELAILKGGCIKSRLASGKLIFRFVLQRVNPLVPRKLKTMEPTDLPVGAPKRWYETAFNTASFGKAPHNAKY